MALNKVEICGVNTSKLPVLTNEEKDILFERIKKGDTEARELYIKGNLRWCSVSSNVSPPATKMWMIYSRLAASG